jgi:uncharacterized protein YgfB (UPF0149 family)
MAYPIINAILVKNGADFSAAEAHGVATGLLCVNENADSAYWLQELLHNVPAIAEEQQQLLLRLFEETRKLLNSDDDFEFDLFLPDETTPLNEQIEALISWCQGFLFGVAAAAPKASYSKEAHEILKDITEFTKLDTDSEDSEQDEIALMELTEYLRTAVLLLRAELADKS